MTMFYGTMFMMAGAYTLVQERSCARRRAVWILHAADAGAIDLTLYIVFFIPGVVALTWAGYNYASESWAINEHSNVTADGPPIYPFKTVIPIAGVILLLQGWSRSSVASFASGRGIGRRANRTSRRSTSTS